MNNEYTMEHINHLAIGNIVSVLDEYETRIAALEAQADLARTATADERCGSTVPANGFDLARYRKLLESCIASHKMGAKATSNVAYYDRCNIQIEAYEHALKLLDA